MAPMRGDADWPHHEVLRLEGFSDAVLAFALTLLVVSLEIPRSFDDLLATLRGAPAFAVCFALFWLIWREHHRFFRRFALEDATTVTLNAVLLFVVLLYVYPLKFLFALLLGVLDSPTAIRPDQTKWLMAIYSSGYAAVFGIFALMYRHAYARRADLALTHRQAIQTSASLGAMLLHFGFGVVSVALALLLPDHLVGFAGLVYFLILPVQWIYWWRMNKHRPRSA
jgi:uncharacterized membrane protein